METTTKRYHITMVPGAAASTLRWLGTEVTLSTASAFDGCNDLALIAVPAEDIEAFEALIDADDAVIEYRVYDAAAGEQVITTEQLWALRDAAVRAGDGRRASVVTSALGGYTWARRACEQMLAEGR